MVQFLMFQTSFKGRRASSRGDKSVPGILLPGKFLSPHVFLQLHCFGVQLASLALGLRTLVGTGSRQRNISRKTRQRCFHEYFSWRECSGGKNRGGTFRREFQGGNIPVTTAATRRFDACSATASKLMKLPCFFFIKHTKGFSISYFKRVLGV